MKLLLDTHAFLWFVWGHAQLSAMARNLMVDPANVLFISIASCWEIAIKAGNKKLALTEPAFKFLQREIIANQINILDVRLEHACAVENLPQHHRDPFDRLIIAQALAEQAPILSADTLFDAYPVTRLW